MCFLCAGTCHLLRSSRDLSWQQQQPAPADPGQQQQRQAAAAAVVAAVMMGRAVAMPAHVHASAAQRVVAGGGAVPVLSILQTASRRHWVSAQQLLTELVCKDAHWARCIRTRLVKQRFVFQLFFYYLWRLL
jgi:hypothetical protein